MKVVKRQPKPGDTVLCGRHHERAYIGKCKEVKEGYVAVEDDGKFRYPHDLVNVWVLE